MKLTLSAFVGLDGVMQGPGGPDEDRSGDFDQGGWVVPFVDEEFGAIVDAWFAQTDEILLGRTTYEMMHAFWSQITDLDDVVAGGRTAHGEAGRRAPDPRQLRPGPHAARRRADRRVPTDRLPCGRRPGKAALSRRQRPRGAHPPPLDDHVPGTLALTLQPAGVLGRGDITVVDGKEFIHKT